MYASVRWKDNASEEWKHKALVSNLEQQKKIKLQELKSNAAHLTKLHYTVTYRFSVRGNILFDTIQK